MNLFVILCGHGYYTGSTVQLCPSTGIKCGLVVECYLLFYFTELTLQAKTLHRGGGRGQYNYIINYYNGYEYSLIKFLN